MPSPLRSLAALTLVLALPATGTLAATFLAEGYSIRVWDTEDGLPQNVVTSAVQTQDGYLWFGTYSGLTRFDGERFQVFDSANTPMLRDPRVARLFEDGKGTLWTGHESGVVTRYRQGRFEPFATPSGTENERIIGLGSDEQGRLWAMRDNGAVDCLDAGTRLPSLIAPNYPGFMAWTRNARGQIWLAENGQAAALVEGSLVPLSLGPALGDGFVRGIAATADGGVWILGGNRIRKWKDGRWVEDRGNFPWPAGTLSCCVELHDGTLAIGTIYSGLYLIFGDGRDPVRFDRSNGMPQNWIRFLYEDREHNLWAGAGSAGLVSIHATAFSVLNSPDQWQGCSVLSLAPDRDNGLWVGTDGAGLYHYSAGRWTRYGDEQGLGNPYITAIAETAAGEVWAGNYWWGGPYRLENGRFVRPGYIAETSSLVVGLLDIPATGELLVSTRDGLLRLHDHQSTSLIKSPGGAADDVCAVTRDRKGVIWCGFAQGGLARLDNRQLTIFRRKDGLASDSVQCLLSDEEGALWIGTADNGLTRFKDGKFANLGRTHGLADNIVCHILDDGLGYYWLSTHHGIQRVAKAELNRCADGTIPVISSQIYDSSDGLPTVEFLGGRQGAGCKTPDGRLWFASSKGIVSVDPKRIEANRIPPPVVLESLWIDGKAVAFLNGAVPVHLAPDHQRLEFRFSGLSFVAPNKVQFKCRLDGIDESWVETGSRRTAFYSRLPAGSYRFCVTASNNDGLWNTQGTSLVFTVAPFFWQTWWFVTLCVSGTLTAVALFARHVTRRRMQRRIDEMERQHEIERERARIAQDIHDDVGASLSRIAMLSQPAKGELANPAHASAVLSRIYGTAREVTKALDEIVWAVDPRHDTLDSLVDYLGRFSQDFLAASTIRCRLDLPVDVPAWPLTAETRHSLFLAFKETLNNAVKHAGATEVRISFDLRPDSFVLTIKDNGCGFDPAQPAGPGRIKPGHGLTNMQRRLARIGGRCEITSQRGKGTRVSLIAWVSNSASDHPAQSSADSPRSDPPPI